MVLRSSLVELVVVLILLTEVDVTESFVVIDLASVTFCEVLVAVVNLVVASNWSALLILCGVSLLVEVEYVCCE
ncbi:hypothetical protein [Fructilactobacillus carniphilus]|uniref:Uncharacterized protein n=1 Tax=Fructilactobacillus carniphilus TaxID=2940297 RepID=A0ABY5BY31_9LACO|nr:hypothetical protein [Fructilactobacillus carniphilus]USS90016.1 hypothetical protein M3M37_03940 [Fructilactobacillus carniphilus]